MNNKQSHCLALIASYDAALELIEECVLKNGGDPALMAPAAVLLRIEKAKVESTIASMEIPRDKAVVPLPCATSLEKSSANP